MSKELMQENIAKAQIEIDKKKNIVKNADMRQHYHFMSETGWLNDPNGLIYFKGKYHFFFQHNPYNAFWDSMHWGHAISDDMINWEYLPLALAPSEEYDNHQRGGCFSGSAIEHDGKLYLMYTAATSLGNGYEQTQCIAYSEDGITFEKYANNPVIRAPKGIPTDKFRDPKVWKHEDTYYMVCGASKDNKGLALLYKSDDMLNWTYFNVLAESIGEWGFMWECPDFFQLGDKYVLTFSPMGAGEHTSVYMVGDFDYKTGKFKSHICDEIDWGFDFYAPQSFVAPDGRRIMVGWSNGWEWMPLWKDWGPTFKEGWCGSFNVPREVCLNDDGTLKTVPIKEIETLRVNENLIDELIVTEKDTVIKAGDGVCFELKFKIDLRNTSAEKFVMSLRGSEGKETLCIFNFKNGEMSVDRNLSDGWSRGISKSILYLNGKDELDVHILSDQSSLEIFSDGYKNNHSNNIFAGNGENKIKLTSCEGEVFIKKVEAYGLR